MSLMKHERRALTERVLRGIRRDKWADDGNAAYEEARSTFTAAQLGALHRAMRQAVCWLESIDEREASA